MFFCYSGEMYKIFCLFVYLIENSCLCVFGDIMCDGKCIVSFGVFGMYMVFRDNFMVEMSKFFN